MSRSPIPTFYFALVVVREGDRFLVVHERKHGQRWYLPAGRVEPGERIVDCARREVLEETGLDVELTGVLRLEHSPMPDYTRVRVFFVARPLGGRAPKSVPDEHSLAARWVTLAELARLPLRGQEVHDIFAAVQAGLAVHPMSLLTDEWAPFR